MRRKTAMAGAVGDSSDTLVCSLLAVRAAAPGVEWPGVLARLRDVDGRPDVCRSGSWTGVLHSSYLRSTMYEMEIEKLVGTYNTVGAVPGTHY